MSFASSYEANQEARRTGLLKRRQQKETQRCSASLRSGCYSLVIDLKRQRKIRVGKLGQAVFPAGTYVYTGSAIKGLGARLRRHCARTKRIHWHIDHLLTLPYARIKKIILYPAAPGQECRQNKRIAACRGAAVILKNFGASDCKSGCASHLLYFSKDFLPKFPGDAVHPGAARNERWSVPELGAPSPTSPF